MPHNYYSFSLNSSKFRYCCLPSKSLIGKPIISETRAITVVQPAFPPRTWFASAPSTQYRCELRLDTWVTRTQPLWNWSQLRVSARSWGSGSNSRFADTSRSILSAILRNRPFGSVRTMATCAHEHCEVASLQMKRGMCALCVFARHQPMPTNTFVSDHAISSKRYSIVDCDSLRQVGHPLGRNESGDILWNGECREIDFEKFFGRS